MSICGGAPDTSGINAAAQANAQVAAEALDWYKQAYSDQAPDRQQATDTARKVSDAQLRAMQVATDQAQDYDTYNKVTFRPLEQKIVNDSQAYDTPERRMQAAAAAEADVDQSFKATQDANERELARSGVAPGSGKYMSLMRDAAIAHAATRAGAGTTAVRNVEQQGYARKMDAAGLGRNLPSNQATQQQIATTTGNSATSNAGAALAAATSGNATMGQGFNTNIAGNTAAGNLFAQAANIDQQSQASALSGIANLGMAAGKLGWQPFAPSDKKVKKGTGRMVNASKALEQIDATPVEDGWSYDPEKGGPDDGGRHHTGPMAQSVRKTMGEDVAPGGRVIDLVSMNGKMMAAIQALSKQVKALEARRA